jgi:hypothetical protein
LRNAVGIDEYDLPYFAHDLGREPFFEPFQTAGHISADHFVFSISTVAETRRRFLF